MKNVKQVAKQDAEILNQ